MDSSSKTDGPKACARAHTHTHHHSNKWQEIRVGFSSMCKEQHHSLVSAAKSQVCVFILISGSKLYLGWNVSSLTMHCFFSGTCFQILGSARSTRALAFRRPNPNRLLTIKPAPFFFQPGLLARGSNSDVQTTKCWRSRQVRSGL